MIARTGERIVALGAVVAATACGGSARHLADDVGASGAEPVFAAGASDHQDLIRRDWAQTESLIAELRERYPSRVGERLRFLG